jgi:hypothetical protein
MCFLDRHMEVCPRALESTKHKVINDERFQSQRRVQPSRIPLQLTAGNQHFKECLFSKDFSALMTKKRWSIKLEGHF